MPTIDARASNELPSSPRRRANFTRRVYAAFALIATLALLAVQMGACFGEPMDVTDACDGTHDDDAVEGTDENVGISQEALSSYDCKERKDTGYTSGKSFKITVVHVDGKPVELNTANAYIKMAQAAQADGVQLRIVSGFRTMKEQQYLYHCYKTCSCNNCNLAAVPGTSNHQSGHALDLNTSSSGVYSWLSKHAGKFGFKRTVPSENWHWEYWGPEVHGPCGGPPDVTAKLVKATSNAKKIKSKKDKAQYEVCAGKKFKFWFQFENTGDVRLVDQGKEGKDYGERVRLEVPGGGKDKLTGKSSVSLDLASNRNVKPTGKKCTKNGCKRTIFPKSGFEATAPNQPGLYTTKWRMFDHTPKWEKDPHAVSKVATLTFRVTECADPGEGSSGSGVSTGSGTGGSSPSSTTGAGAGSGEDPSPGEGGGSIGSDDPGSEGGEADWSDEQATEGELVEEDEESALNAEDVSAESGCAISSPNRGSSGGWLALATAAAVSAGVRLRRRARS